ncbi:hypothetical protein LguiB_007286 [Lonicera macranthoides]
MGNGEMIMQEIKKTSIGKATVLALGKAFPHQLVMQEYLINSLTRVIAFGAWKASKDETRQAYGAVIVS